MYCGVFKEKNSTRSFSTRVEFYSRAKYVVEQKVRFACLSGNHSAWRCSRAKKCPNPCAIAHITYCSMEPINYFLGRKTRMTQIRLEQISPRTKQTLHPTPLLVMYMTLNHLKFCRLPHFLVSSSLVNHLS